MTETKAELSEATQFAVEELLTALKNPSKLTRRMALERFHKETVERVTKSSEPLQDLYASISTQLLRALGDDSEQCRFAAAALLQTIVEHCSMSDYQLTYVMPAIVKRVGQPEIVEDSEELRLQFIQLVRTIIAHTKPPYLEPFITDCTSILCKTCQDPFPEARIEACLCIQDLCIKIPRVFYMQAESFVKPLFPSLSHQRFKVRVSAVETLGSVMMHGPSKCLELSVTPLAEKLFDEVAAVRRAVLVVAARCMLEHRDRYSYWHRLLPLILTGLSDAMDSVREETAKAWDQIGLKFMEENDEDLKKIINFMPNELPEGYPQGVSRPNLGCRTLVERNIGKILPAIEKECGGWQEDVRYRVVQLLGWLLLCAEDKATQHSLISLNILMSVRDEQRTACEMKKAAKYFGTFIDPATWWPLLRPSIETWPAIQVLAYIVLGARDKLLRNDAAVLKEFMGDVSDPEVCQTRREKHQQALLELCCSVMEALGRGALVVNEQTFAVAFCVYCVAEEDAKRKALDALRALSALSGHGDGLSELFSEHVKLTVQQITSDPLCWTVAHPHFCAMHTLLTEFGGALGLITPELTELLRRVLTLDKLDGKVKVKLFNALSMALIDKRENFKMADREALIGFYNCIWDDIVSKELVWRAGLTAESVRCAAVSCACCLLQSDPTDTREADLFRSGERASDITEQMCSLFPSLLDDRCHLTRLRAVNAVVLCADNAHRTDSLTVERLHKIYYAVLKRLDDSSEAVRSAAATALVSLFRRRPASYDTATYRPHVDTLYSTMLIHLDGDDEEKRLEILKCLQELAELDPELMMKKLEANLPLYRNKEAFETLQKTIANMSIKC